MRATKILIISGCSMNGSERNCARVTKKDPLPLQEPHFAKSYVLMNLFWHVCALFATQCCLGAEDDDTDLGPCNSAGELPAPMIFLNATSAQVGERVSLRCMPSDSRASKFVFCKNGHLIASRKALPQDISYTLILLISEQSEGRYSCGYQKKDGNSQKNSALSADSNLIILPGNADPTSGNSNSNGFTSILSVQSWMIISGVAGVAILILIPLIYLLIKKNVSHWRTSRAEGPRVNGDHLGSEEQVLYDNIEDFRSQHSPSQDSEIPAISLYRKPGLRFGPACQTTDVSHEDIPEWIAPHGARESKSTGAEFRREYENITALKKSAEECAVQFQNFTCSSISS